jgi:hypothetical protein
VQFDRCRWYLIKVAAGLIRDARAPHAITRAGSLVHIESAGKPRVSQGGKRSVNKTGEQRDTPRAHLHGAIRSRDFHQNANARDKPGRLTDRSAETKSGTMPD